MTLKNMKTVKLPLNTKVFKDRKPALIGIMGPKFSGKSTAARYLHAAHGYTVVPYAKTLKDMLRVVGLTDAQLDGTDKDVPLAEFNGKTARDMMISLGTDWRDMVDTKLWLTTWQRNYREALLDAERLAAPELCVVDDVRRDCEAQQILSYGGVLIEITGYGYTMSHATERPLRTKPDIWIDNSIKDLTRFFSLLEGFMFEARCYTNYNSSRSCGSHKRMISLLPSAKAAYKAACERVGDHG